MKRQIQNAWHWFSRTSLHKPHKSFNISSLVLSFIINWYIFHGLVFCIRGYVNKIYAANNKWNKVVFGKLSVHGPRKYVSHIICRSLYLITQTINSGISFGLLELNKMALPSITTIGSVLFLAYMFNSIWSIGKLYFPPKCDETLDSKMVSIVVQ